MYSNIFTSWSLCTLAHSHSSLTNLKSTSWEWNSVAEWKEKFGAWCIMGRDFISPGLGAKKSKPDQTKPFPSNSIYLPLLSFVLWQLWEPFSTELQNVYFFTQNKTFEPNFNPASNVNRNRFLTSCEQMLNILPCKAGLKTELHIISCYDLLPKKLKLAKLNFLLHFTSVISVTFPNSASPPLLNLSPKLTVWPIDREGWRQGENRKRKTNLLSVVISCGNFVFCVFGAKQSCHHINCVSNYMKFESTPIHSWMTSEPSDIVDKRWKSQSIGGLGGR